MSWYDLFVLCLVVGYCAYVMLRKNKRGCNGNCDNCRGCADKENQKEN